MEQPTKKDIDEIRYVAVVNGDKDIIELCDAYLALREEVKEKSATIKRHMESIIYRGEQIDRLEAENQALRAESMKSRHILSHIEATTVLNAKEKAGYGEQVKHD